MNKYSIREKPVLDSLRHVVLLGAGASRATCPNGDFMYEKKLPVMNELPDILGEQWKKLLLKSEVPYGNFEFQYSWIKSKGCFKREIERIDFKLKQYFRHMELPDQPTIYDYLLLGLREKDVVATFNWDPLLLKAYERNREVCKLPNIRFLHGCVSYFTCKEHDIIGSWNMVCPICKKELIQSPIIYPEENKDYTNNWIIKREWDLVKKALGFAFHLTVFGYSAPKTDYNARKLLLDSWWDQEPRDASHIEIIDIASPDNLSENWKEFIPYDHIIHEDDFFDSSVAKWPRHTFEWKQRASVFGVSSEDSGVFKTDSLNELQDWFHELEISENEIKKRG